MSASIRFLGLAVVAWVGVRAASLGMVPGIAGFATPAGAAGAPASPARLAAAGAPTQSLPAQTPYGATSPPPGYAPYPPAYPPYPAYAYGPPPGAYPQPYPQPVPVPYYVAAAAPWPRTRGGRAAGWAAIAPTPLPLYDGWAVVETAPPPPATRVAAAGLEPVRPGPAAAVIPGPAGAPVAKAFDRLQLSAWALLRGSWGPGNLATGGTLGGSQVGGRLTYRFNPQWAASLRSSSSVGGVRYAEVAAGVRWQPLASLPVALNFERRQALNRWGGRNAFALFAEGGVYQRPVFGIGNLDAYALTGVVGLKSRDWFFDGAATVSRPVWKKFSAGLGVWGGAQPGLYRVDAGPRLSYDVGRGIRLHADYRQRLAGEALPNSGPALTIAADW